MEYDIDKMGEPFTEVGSQPRLLALMVTAILLITFVLVLVTYEGSSD